MAWYNFSLAGDPNAPSARECHSINTRGTELVLFGGNDNASRMGDVYVLDTSESSPPPPPPPPTSPPPHPPPREDGVAPADAGGLCARAVRRQCTLTCSEP
jgi:hypothetical protein